MYVLHLIKLKLPILVKVLFYEINLTKNTFIHIKNHYCAKNKNSNIKRL